MGKISQALPEVKLLTCGPALLAALAPLLAALAALAPQPTDLAALVARRAAQAAGPNSGRTGEGEGGRRECTSALGIFRVFRLRLRYVEIG